jgi:putative ABC transport system permease protein
MRFIHRVVALVRELFGAKHTDADFANEIQFHIDRETEANVARGMTWQDAERAARIRFGSVDSVVETSRDERSGASIRQIGRDVRFGIRLLAKAPAFAIAAIAVVALGIGAVTSIFSVVYGVMLDPLPYRDPSRLVNLWSVRPSINVPHFYPSAADVLAWQKSTRTIDDIATVRLTANFNLVGTGEAERLQGARFSSNLFSVLGVKPAMGRGFAADENQPGRDQVVILSDGFWRRRFAADPSIIGRTISLNGLTYAIIGVMPQDFQFPSRDYQAYVPLVLDPREMTREQNQNYLAVGRLKPGVTVAQAQTDLDRVAHELELAFPATNRGTSVNVEPMLDSSTRDIKPALIALLGASACLLLIACLNLANLLGARATSRGGELAVRLALGASRSRLVAQTIAEVAPLLAVGGVLGVGAAYAGVQAFVAAAPPGIPRIENIAISAPVIVVALIVLVITGLAASLAPATQAWSADFTSVTKERGRSSTGGRRSAVGRRIGVAAQIAFAVPLLVGAGLLVRSSLALAQVDLGFKPEHVTSFHLAVSRTKYPQDAQVATFYSQLLQRVSAVPGVTHAGMVNRLPLVGNQTMTIHVEQAAGNVVELSAVDSRPATPDYFAALGISLKEGRTFGEQDDAGAPQVAIVDDKLARAMWPGESAIGKRVQRFDDVWCTVIGVVGHIHASTVDADPRQQVYWSYKQATQDRMVLVVRGEGPATALIAPVTSAIHEVDRDQPLYDVRTMESVVGRSLIQRRLTTVLIGSFGAIALMLAAVGIYGVIAYRVSQRLREFGIRVALGATQREVSRLVIGEGASMAVIGSAVGLVAALGLAGTMQSLVFGVTAHDAMSFVAATGALLVVAMIASYIPSRRASAVDPALTLRSE